MGVIPRITEGVKTQHQGIPRCKGGPYQLSKFGEETRIIEKSTEKNRSTKRVINYGASVGFSDSPQKKRKEAPQWPERIEK